MLNFIENIIPTTVAVEACGGSRHWARLLGSFGHDVTLVPQLPKPSVKHGKNDVAEAEALCEAMSRPTMRFVTLKTADQQAALMLAGVRQRLLHNRTQLANAIPGFAIEFGGATAKGMCRIEPLLERLAADESLPESGRELLRKFEAVDEWLINFIALMNAAGAWPKFPGSARSGHHYKISSPACQIGSKQACLPMAPWVCAKKETKACGGSAPR